MPFHKISTQLAFSAAAVVAVGLAVAGAARGCPFCSATQRTLGEELLSTDAAVLARLEKAPPPYDPNKDDGASFRSIDPESSNATFRIVEKLRGGEHLVGIDSIEVTFFGQPDKEKLFLITGIRTDRLDWTTPLPLSKPAEDYVRKLMTLPEKGPERLAYFQDFLEHEDPMLAQDAYDEFARAPYDVVIAMKDHMHHDRLVEWIHNVELPPSRRQLYLTMLGVCGKPSDLPMLEYYMSPTAAHYKAASDAALAAGVAFSPRMFQPVVHDAAERHERYKRQGLDAMIACYLKLKGADGLPLVEELFLKDPHGEYKDTFSAISALRFHGDQTEVIPRERLAESMRLVLDNPTFADLVIADLSRWEDWGVMDRLAQMFKDAEKTSYVRLPIATYMLVAAEQEGDVGERATAHLAGLREIDKQTVDDAERNLGFGLFAQAVPRKTDGGGAATNRAATPETAAQVEAAPGESPVTPPGAGDSSLVAQADSVDTQPDDDPFAEGATSAAGDATGGPSEPVADTDPQPGDSSTAAATEGVVDTRHAQTPTDETDAISPPSRGVLVGGTVLAVAVLAGLFAVLLRGFSR
jgi:hypothetical protein